MQVKCKKCQSLLECSRNRKDCLCQSCKKKYFQDWFQRHKERLGKQRKDINLIYYWRHRSHINNTDYFAKKLKKLYFDNPYCYYCKIKLEPNELHFEHKIPKVKGGIDKIKNIVISCGDCNRLKYTKTEKEFNIFIKEYIKRFS